MGMEGTRPTPPGQVSRCRWPARSARAAASGLHWSGEGALIDSHAHLAMIDPAALPGVLGRAHDAGVTTILVPATGREDLDTVAELAGAGEGRIVGGLGFHPHEASRCDAAWQRRLERLLESPGIVAVGEIGLDYHYDLSPREDQRRVLAWQLDLARERGLPVVLHHREAWEDFLAALDAAPGVRGVAHSFTEGVAGVEEMSRRGLFVGISGMVTFPKAENIREAARAVPSGRLLLETDTPYLAPVPHRGRPNEPAYVRLVLEQVARTREADAVALEAETDAAFGELFLGDR
jgi:TatD DNase family protein